MKLDKNVKLTLLVGSTVTFVFLVLLGYSLIFAICGIVVFIATFTATNLIIDFFVE